MSPMMFYAVAVLAGAGAGDVQTVPEQQAPVIEQPAAEQPAQAEAVAAAQPAVEPAAPVQYASLPTERMPPATVESKPASSPIVDKPVEKKKDAVEQPLFSPSLLLQGWFVSSRQDATTSTFRIRRAEIALKGVIVPDRLSYGVMIDPARLLEFKDTKLAVAAEDGSKIGEVTAKQPVGASTIFQDFYIRFMFEYADVSIGQFKIPVSMEGFGSSSKLLLPERSMVAREFGDKRDLGVSISKKFTYFGYTAGIYNGAALNNLDIDNAKDAGLRLEAYPIKGLTLAGVAYGSIGARDTKPTKDRLEADVKLEMASLLVQGEYIRAWTGGGDARSAGHGFYAAAGYTLFDALQPMLRIGYLDTDLAKDLDPTAAGGKDEGWEYNIGLNYTLMTQAKLMASFARIDYQTKKDINELIVAAQLSF